MRHSPPPFLDSWPASDAVPAVCRQSKPDYAQRCIICWCELSLPKHRPLQAPTYLCTGAIETAYSPHTLHQYFGRCACSRLDSPFEPHSARTSDQQIEVAEDRGAAILPVEELVHEEMHRRTERI